MTADILNKCVFATYSPDCKSDEIAGCLGFYAFRLLQADESGAPDDALIYGMYAARQYGRVILLYDGGDAPSVRAGLALDLHRGATAQIRADALKIKTPVAYFIDDAGKLAAMSWAAFAKDRAPQVLAQAGALAAFDNVALYRLLTASDSPAPVAAPAPPAP
jgi:hypothetical protein